MKALNRKLTLDEIDFRVGMIKANAKGAFATLLAYKDARVDMKILDEAVGQHGWQNEYKRDSKGVLQCGIAIKHEGEWIWKWSNGVESFSDSEKGEYSDAFKRAGFMWGIGRHLYDMPFLYCELKEGEYYKDGNKIKATSKFKPNAWRWTMDEYIKAVDKDGTIRVNAKL